MKLKLLFLLLAATGLSLAARAQGTVCAASGSGTAGVGSADWILGSISADGIPAAAVLPVHFGAITATVTNNRLLVKWATETETGNDHFEIEVSRDGKQFKKIGSLSSKAPNGSSAAALQYEFQTELTGITLALGLLCGMGLFAKGRRSNRPAILFLLMAVAFLAACTKKDQLVRTGNAPLNVRIVQVDKDGARAYSKVIVAVQEN